MDAYGPGRTIYLSPAGKTFCEADARRLRDGYSHLILVCGHYEGIDERFIEECVDEEISIGDFVLTGGDLPAMVVADAVARLVPGVLSDPECFENESHWNGLLEYPQYSRPEEWHGRRAAQAGPSPHPPAPPGPVRPAGSILPGGSSAPAGAGGGNRPLALRRSPCAPVSELFTGFPFTFAAAGATMAVTFNLISNTI